MLLANEARLCVFMSQHVISVYRNIKMSPSHKLVWIRLQCNYYPVICLSYDIQLHVLNLVGDVDDPMIGNHDCNHKQL